jgi:hypothetical protein
LETRERGELRNIVGEEPQGEEVSNESLQSDGSEDSLQGEEGDRGEIVPLRLLNRPTQPSTRLRDYMTYSIQYLIQDYRSYENVSNKHYTFLNSLSRIEEPSTYEIAKKEPK